MTGELAVPTPERPLPLFKLDRALAPIRRVVRFALAPGGLDQVRFLGANLRRHLDRALTLDLPEALREPLAAMAVQVEGFDADDPEGRRGRLSVLYASVARLDALAGLPLHVAPKPVPKPRQLDVPEVDAPPPVTEPTVEDTVAETVEETVEAEDTEAGDEEDEEEEAPAEFTGDLAQPLADWTAEAFPGLAERLRAHGIETFRDLVLRRPAAVEVLEPIHGAGRDLPEGRVAVGGRIRSGWTVRSPGGRVRRWSRLVGAGPVRVCWADERAPWRGGDRKVVVAATHRDGDLLDAEIVLADGNVARLPAWGLPGVEDREIRALWSAISDRITAVRDPVSPDVLRRLSLASTPAAIVAAQARGAEEGRRRLAFDEALLASLAGVLPRLQPGRDRGYGHPVLHGFAGRATQSLELVLYDDAQACLEEVKRDLRRSTPMRRVITGEVGAGKGRIALLAIAMVAEAKGQVLVLGTDALDAENRFLYAEPILREEGLVARLVSSPPTNAQRDAIRRGEVHVVFGTLDLLEHEIEYRRLGLVVAVEREQWGRASVAHAALPAPRPDLLVVTAIPVGPRVLLTAYADHHVSIVVDPKRRPARITLCRADERGSAYAKIRAAVAAGAQGVVVIPMVDGRDAVEIPDALRLVRALEADALAGLKVGLLHGAMPREERARIYDDFQHRRCQVLVSTTRIEDAPTIPGASVLVIEQADRVDQWRLHRLIGFFSRAALPAEAVLVVGEMAEPDAAARIERVVNAPNGFHLTEALVQLRGIDRSVAAGATPLPRFDWLDLDRDRDLVLAAREEAHRVLRADPGLRRGAHADLARELRARWSRFWPDGEARGWVCTLREDAPPEPKRRRRRRRRKR